MWKDDDAAQNTECMAEFGTGKRWQYASVNASVAPDDYLVTTGRIFRRHWMRRWRRNSAACTRSWLVKGTVYSNDGACAAPLAAHYYKGRRMCFVAGEGDGLVGMVGADWDAPARRVDLVALWVDPARRGEGIGAALVEAVVGWGAAHRADRVQLWVVDEATHAAAQYSACGFVESGVRQTGPYSPQQRQKLLIRRL